MNLLFLSNTRTNENKEILELISSILPNGSKIGYIPASPDDERIYLNETKAWFSKTQNTYSFDYLDIHNQNNWSFERLKDYSGIFISGGNTYSLMTALRVSGIDLALKELAHKTQKLIIGVSAGGIVLTPDIRIASSENELGITDSRGLCLVEFGFCPHFLNQAEELSEINEYMRASKVRRVLAVPETSAVHVSMDQIVLYGDVSRIDYGK